MCCSVQMGPVRVHPRANTPLIDAGPHQVHSQPIGCAAPANKSVVCLQNNVFNPQSGLVGDCSAGCDHKRRQLTGRRLVSNRRTGNGRISAIRPGTPWIRRRHLLAVRTVPAPGPSVAVSGSVSRRSTAHQSHKRQLESTGALASFPNRGGAMGDRASLVPCAGS